MSVHIVKNDTMLLRKFNYMKTAPVDISSISRVNYHLFEVKFNKS